MPEKLEKKKVSYFPIVKYDFLSLESQKIYSPGIGLVAMNENVMIVGIYTHHTFKKNLKYNYPDKYHTIDILLDASIDRNQYLGILKSESDQPIYGGLKTFQFALGYGYELIHNPKFSLVLGGGLAVSDFGVEFSNGKTCPVIPVPLIRAKYKSQLVESKFEFLTGPNFDLTLGPKSQFRWINECRLDQFRDNRDIIFESTLNYRFFPEDHAMGDFAGIAIGIKNDNYGAFDLGEYNKKYPEDNESFEAHYNSIFGVLDLSLLKFTGGYTFNGRELYREEDKRDIGEGYFLSIKGMYQF